MYTPDRLASIAAEAAKDNSIFSLDDRLGLVHDAFALSKAGLAKVSSALTLVDLWKNEKEREGLFFYSEFFLLTLGDFKIWFGPVLRRMFLV